jgi:MYXO-CTERM domain-containing protein
MGQLFQVDPPFGSNIEPPNPAFIALNRALAYDSWITTPGETALTGADLPGDGTGAWGDATDDGPQSSFQFARMTTPVGVLVRFAGVVRVAGEHGPEDFPFSIFDVPEPGGVALAVLAGLGLGRARRRQASRVGG